MQIQSYVPDVRNHGWEYIAAPETVAPDVAGEPGAGL